MKNLLLFFVLQFICGVTFAQEEVFADPETPAEFPGGFAELNQWLVENVKYPQEALEYGLMGSCYIKMMVSVDGVCSDFKIVRGVIDCPSCDTEALRVMKLMPKWNPALLDGKPIAAGYIVRVIFKLH